MKNKERGETMDEVKQRNFGGKFISTALICATIVWATTYYVSHMQNSAGTRISDATGTINNIAVNGEGKVYGKPDILKIQVGVSELAPTSKEAQAKLNASVQKVLNALQGNAVENKDIQTIDLSLTQEIEWNNNTKKILGQRATQRFMITIRNIQKDLERSGKVIDSIASINGVEIGSMQFDIEDKTDLFSNARELAFKKASQKGTELAKLSGLSISKPISIKELIQDPYIVPYQNSYFGKSVNSMDSTTQIPSGQMEITVQLEVLFGFKS